MCLAYEFILFLNIVQPLLLLKKPPQHSLSACSRFLCKKCNAGRRVYGHAIPFSAVTSTRL